MTYNIHFTLGAEEDLENAFSWYENESSGLGWEFRNEIALCIDKIVNDNVSYPIYFGSIRKISVSRFPYIVYFIKKETKGIVVIGAILHEKRSPDTIHKHLGI